MTNPRTTSVILTTLFYLTININYLWAEPTTLLKPEAKCPVCGMFVAKYTAWMAQILHVDGTRQTFDGVKDMLAYYYNPNKYSTIPASSIKEVWVKDYYSLDWIDGRKAFFVVGSNIFGPMGHEFIPFSTKEAADNFFQDHKGKQVLNFQEVDKTLVDTLRSGSTMNH